MTVRQMLGYFTGAILGMLAAAVALLFYLAFFDLREPPIKMIYTYPGPVANNAAARQEIIRIDGTLKPGQRFYSYREFCVLYPYRVLVIQRRFIPLDPQIPALILPSTPARILTEKVGCRNRSLENRVPLEARTGEYGYEISVYYKLDGNSIAIFHYDWAPVRVRVER
jgi:hypothetical protein